MADSSAPLAGLLRWLGVEVVHVSHRERWVSALGAMVAIATTYLISRVFLDVQASLHGGNRHNVLDFPCFS